MLGRLGSLAGRASKMYAGLSGAGKATLGGAALGAGYGMASSDTSVLGGALMGAGAGRYGRAGLGFGRGAFSRPGLTIGSRLSQGSRGAGRGIMAQARMDYRGARLAGNKGANGFRVMRRNMFGGMGGGF